MGTNDNKYMWKTPLIFVCIILLLTTNLWLREPFADMSEKLHWGCLGGVAVISLILFLGLLTHKRGIIAVTLSAIAISGSIFVGYQYDIPVIQQVIAKRGISSTIDELTQALERSSGGERINLGIDTKPVASGDAGEIESTFRSFLIKTLDDHNDYIDEVTDSGIDTVFDGSLGGDPGLKKSKRIISTIKGCISKYRKRSFARFRNTRKEIERLDIDKNLKKDVLTHYDKSWKQTKPVLIKRWDIESNALKEYEKMINHLSFTKGSWRFTNNELRFKTDYNVKKYNNYIHRLEELELESKNLQRESLQSLRSFIRK